MTARQRLPDRRASTVFQCGAYTVTRSNFGDGRLAEIFLDHRKPNSELAELANDCVVLVSLLLQHGITAASIRHSISGPIAKALDMAMGGES